MSTKPPVRQRPEYNAASYWSDRLTGNWSLRGVGYLGYTERYNAFLYQAKLRAMHRVLAAEQVDLRGQSVLDLGPGIGFWLQWYLAQDVHRVAGLEIAEPAVSRLKQAFPVADVRQGDIGGEWPFTEQFDLISAFDVLYHIVDDDRFARALRTATRHLKPGGLLLLTDQMAQHDVPAVRHVRFHGLHTYRDILADSDCEIRHVEPVYRFLNGGLANAGVIRRTQRLQSLVVHLENWLAPLLYRLDSLPIMSPNLRLLVVRKAYA